MKTALVLGGTRFFGKRLVQRLLDKNVEVTIATRGQTVDSFGDQVKRIIVDRYDRISMGTALADIQYDVVFDQIGYAPSDALDACEIFAGKIKRYVFTSTLSVYELSEEKLREENFDSYTYPIQLGRREEFTYNEGKRLAEAVFFQKASFPVVVVRFPIVMGTDDYTKRLLFHIQHIKNEIPFGLPNPEAILSFISSDDAARFLQWAAESTIVGPINACSGDIKLRDLFHLIEEKVGKKAIMVKETEEEHMSPYGVPKVWCLDTTKARESGYTFDPILKWLPQLINDLS